MKTMTNRELLTKLVEGLKTLRQDEFDYEFFVSNYDSEKKCGTVCCAWGWTPRFVPECGVKWIESDISKTAFGVVSLDTDYVDFMFYGGFNNKEIYDEHLFGDGFNTNIQQVINRIEYVLQKAEGLDNEIHAVS